MLAVALHSSLLLSHLVPQGPVVGGAQVLAVPSPSLPAQPALMAYAPWPGGGAVRAAGTIDLDGNRIPDAWFLGEAGAIADQLRLAMGREQCPGRFRDWPQPWTQPVPIADAATLRVTTAEQDRLLYVHPSLAGIATLAFDLPSLADPHAHGSWLQSWLVALPPLTNVIEIETANHDGDQCDDVVLLLDAGALGTTVVKFGLDAPFGVPMLTTIHRVDVPLPLRRLRVLDWDRDGRTDVAAEVPGLGVVVGRDDGAGGFALAAFTPTAGAPFVELAAGPVRATAPGHADAVVLTFTDGVQVLWHDGSQQRAHWLPSPNDPLGGAQLLGVDRDHVVVFALPAAGNRLLSQVLTRTGACLQPALANPPDPIAYWGPHTACRVFAADVDGDGDQDAWVQHPDGCSLYAARNDGTTLAPELLQVTHDPSLSASGWYLETYHLRVPTGWDFTAFPQVELQVMVEDPFGFAQQRWDRLVHAIDPITRRVTFTVAWQENQQTTAAFLQNRNLLPPAFAQQGIATAGRRTQLNFCALGPGNLNFNDAERRGEPLLLYHDPGGSGNKSAQGVLWEKRPTPPLPRADQAILPWR